jgi:hypothetical protein
MKLYDEDEDDGCEDGIGGKIRRRSDVPDL